MAADGRQLDKDLHDQSSLKKHKDGERILFCIICHALRTDHAQRRRNLHRIPTWIEQLLEHGRSQRSLRTALRWSTDFW